MNHSSGNWRKGDDRFIENNIPVKAIAAGTNGLDKEELDDILMLLKYTATDS